MRIGVMSDSHGAVERALIAASKMDDVDLIIHLGDYIEDSKYLKKHINKKIISIKGNCDRGIEEKGERVVSAGSFKLLAVHGHQYGVKMGLNRLYYRALELGCGIALYGHTHVPLVVKYDDILIMNPGSIGYPRGGAKPSFGMINLEKENVNCEIITI